MASDVGSYGVVVEGIEAATEQYINERFSSAIGHAEDAYSRAIALLGAMAGLVLNLQTINSNITISSNDLNIVVPPQNFIRPVDPNITSSLLTATQAALLNIIQNGGSGLPIAIENAMYQRGYDRAMNEKQNSMTKVSEEWARRGYRLPPAMLAAQINDIEVQFLLKKTDDARDISIKQAETAISQLNEALKDAASEELGRIDNLVKMFSADTTLYSADADVYKTTVETQIKVVEAKMELLVQQATIALKNAEINMKQYEVVSGVQIEGMKSMAAISAQLVAGSLAGISTSAHIAAQGTATIHAQGTSHVSVSTSTVTQDITNHTGGPRS